MLIYALLAIGACALQNGDLMFVSPPYLSDPQSAFDDAILATGDATLRWMTQQGLSIHGKRVASHVALAKVMGDEVSFVEAVPYPGVHEIPAEVFFREQPPNTTFYLGRVDTSYVPQEDRELLIGRVLQVAQSQIGKPYANLFELPPKTFYCSSLVDYSFTTASDQSRTVFLPSHTPDFKLIFEPLDFWKDYYHNLGEELPINVTGSNPSLLLNSPIVSAREYDPRPLLRDLSRAVMFV